MKHSRFSALFACALLAGLLSGCNPPRDAPSTPPKAVQVAQTAEKATPEGRLVDESWQVNFLHGAKLGYGHAVVRSLELPQGEVVRTTVTQTLRLQRYGQTTDETLSFSCDDTPTGQVIAFDCQAAAMGLQAKGKMAGDFLQITTATKGKSSTETIPWNKETFGYCGLDDSFRRQPMQPGEKRRVKWLQPLLHLVSEDTLEAEAEEEVDLLGEKRKLLKIKCTGQLGKQKIHRTLWTDEQGLIWKSANPESGEENFRTTEEVAKAPSESAFDLGLSTIVKVSRSLDNPHETNRIAYRATLKHRNPADVFIAYDSQSVNANGEHTAEIVVRRVQSAESPQVEPKVALPEPADLAANNLIQSDDQLVRQMAAKIAEDEQDPVKIAMALEKSVHTQMRSKSNFSTAFATAADVAKSLSGDCTEHAVLLAALLRARKIPARVVAGLVYVAANPEKKMPQGFAYHMWTEAWTGDRWLPLDATLGRGGIGAAHLKLSDSNLNGVSALEALLPVMNVLGQLELEILEVE